MLTDEDIKNLIEQQKQVFVTKEDNNRLSALVVSLKSDVDDVKKDVSGLREQVQSLTISIDKLVKAVETLGQEYSVIAHQMNRHEKWIQQLADKMGLKLEH